MKSTIRRSVPVEITYEEKFSMIYMEVQIAPDTGGFKELSKVIWHLEDENRPTVALCGRELHNVAKSASPALAMLGKPCPQCKVIVKEYLKTKKTKTLMSRIISLILNDTPFRKNVSRCVKPELFVANMEQQKGSARGKRGR